MKKGLITSILALTFSGIQAQTLPPAPRLVVTLAIDQLRTDYMEAFSSLYGEKGFKRLMREAKVFRQAQYAFNSPDRASAIASVYTGTTPSMNGIIAQEWFDTGTLRTAGCVDDPNYMGNYTDENSSPVSLLVSTLPDELKIATRNRALVYAIAPFRDAAILSAGHAADGAFWINETTGKWCGTTYYQDFPWWVNQYNDSRSADFRIKDMVWTPVHAAAQYKYLPEWRTEPFKYFLGNDRINCFRHLISSPFANDEVNMLAGELLDKSTVGQDSITDMLALTYYAGNYNHRPKQECAMELQDTYVRLDRSIATLLEMLEKKVGLHNVLLCVTSTGYVDPDTPDTGLYRIPGSEFHLNRCATLLNMYLMAIYGEGQYVEGYFDRQIYLNHKLIEDKQLDLSDIQEKSAQFLIQFSGVNEVYSAYRLLLGAWSPAGERVRNGYHRKRSGDFVIEVLPGWTVVHENPNESRAVRVTNTPAPMIWLGGNVKAETIKVPVCADRVAPTLCRVMRIRSPNGCNSQPLEL